jgi:hypothetical protein
MLLCLAALGATLLLAQHPDRPVRRPASKLRATGILELAANGRARLIPIVIKVGDKFFDGGLYHADPSPMALESGTVYEAERAGDSLGLFTVTKAQDVSGVWVGLGQWRSEDSQKAKPAPAKSVPQADDDERPILRKPKSTAAQSSSPSPSPTPFPTASPAPESKPAAESKPASASSPAPSPSPAEYAAMEQDAARPILRRGKPAAQESADELPPLIAEKPGAAHSTPGAAGGGLEASSSGVEVLTAVSDAGGPDPRPYTMQLSSEEQVRFEKAVRQMAYAAVSKYAASRPQHRPAAATEFVEAQFRAFDAHTNNEPDLVFSAALPERLPRGASSGFRYLVTVVARVDIYGDLHQLLAQVTDSAHLDAYPRLELIDVVDAEGAGTGQLLFREISDTGYDYALYRIGADKLWLLFQGAGKNF